MKIIKWTFLLLTLLIGAVVSIPIYLKHSNPTYSWRYKMTVTVETPEGDISGSAVRQMGDNYKVSFPVEASNYGEVMGEAVVVDLGARGVLFVLIDHESDLRFYYTFPEGSETPEGYAYYASLPIGTKAQMPLSSRMPKLVTFTDMDDPKSVTLVYQRSLCREAKPLPEACAADPKGSYASTDRFEELFGEGVKLKDITLEITDEPVTWGVVDQWLPEKLENLKQNWKELSYPEKARINPLIRFKRGEPK